MGKTVQEDVQKENGRFFFTSVDVHFHANASDFERRCL